MSSPLKAMESLIAEHGGKFIRVTGKGHRRWRIGATFLDLPVKGLDAGRLRANVEQQIRRAIRAQNGEREATRYEEPVGSVVESVEVEATEAARGTAEAPARDGDRAGADAPPDPVGDGTDDGGDVVQGIERLPEPAPEDAPVADPGHHRAPGPPYHCQDCGRNFALPQGLGRHRSAFHPASGVATPNRPRRPAKPAPEPTISAPKKAAEPTATSSKEALGDLVGRFMVAVEAALALGQELATEHRLIREENGKLRALVGELESAFDLARSRTMGPTAKDQLRWR